MSTAESAERFTVLIVPGLRDAVDDHWQTLLQRTLRSAARPVASVLPMGRDAAFPCDIVPGFLYLLLIPMIRLIVRRERHELAALPVAERAP